MRTFISKLILASAATLAIPAVAGAAVTLSSVTPGNAVYSGPAPTYDFDGLGGPVTDGLVTTGSESGIRAQPLGSTGNYWTVGPSDGSPAVLDLSSIGDIHNVSFLWGSVDTHNLIEFLDENGDVIDSFTGLDIVAPANGAQGEPSHNPIVRFDVTGNSVTRLTSLRLSSTSNAFETDNFTINAVPEPGTWMLMMAGFGLVGFGMRRRRDGRRLQFT